MRVAPFFLVSVLVLLSCADNGVKPPGGGEEGRPDFWGMPPAVINEIYAVNTDFRDKFGNVAVEPREYLTVFLSGKNRPTLSRQGTALT